MFEAAGKIDRDIADCDAIVDAILGTAIIRNVEGPYRKVIKSINQSEKKVFRVDIPSSIRGDTGKILGTAVNAHYTVTFGFPKIENVLFPTYDRMGKLFVSHISFSPSLTASDREELRTRLYG